MPLTPPEARPSLIVVMGPTAVGKTDLGIHLGRIFDGEVINADSRYLYRGFDIGVAKPAKSELQGVPHHLIDILEPGEEMSLALFQTVANQAIAGVISRGNLPLLVGGTPLYINAVIEGWRIPEVPPSPEFRRRMEQLVETSGIEPLLNSLRKVDPESALRSGTNPRRVIRALEIYEQTRKPMSALQGKGPRPYRTLEIGLWMPREALYAAIDARVDIQTATGLVEEVRSLLERGVDPECPAFSSIGYRQLLPYIDGEITLGDAVQRIRFDTHRYVRHQETWLKRNPRLVRIDVTETGWMTRCEELVRSFLTPAP